MMWALWGYDDSDYNNSNDMIIATFDDRNALETYRAQSTRVMLFENTYVEENYSPPPHNPLPEQDEAKTTKAEPVQWTEGEFSKGLV